MNIDKIQTVFKWAMIALIVIALGIFLNTFTDSYKLNKLNSIKQEIIEQTTININADVTENIKDKTLIRKLQKNIKVRENNISRLNACRELNKLLINTLKEEIKCDTIAAQKLLKPDELFYTIKVSDKPYVTQNEEEHFKRRNGYILATDVATGFKAELYAPDYLGKIRQYKVSVKKDNLLGNYVELNWKDKTNNFKWVLGHIETKLKDGDIVYTGQKIGQMDKSGVTTGYHSHVELHTMVSGIWNNISYTTRSKVLNNRRAGVYENDGKGSPIYFTTYDLGDVNQNDADACIAASGKNVCDLAEQGIQTIALTVDQRKLYNIKFGDRITLRTCGPEVGGHCEFYDNIQVEDEMNQRFRYSCIKKQGECIKGDIARYKGKSDLPSGVYTIIK